MKSTKKSKISLIIYLDATVLVSFYKKDEKYSKEIDILFERTLGKDILISSEWSQLEFIRGLMKTKVNVRTIRDDLDDLSLSVVFIPIKSAWISRAKELILRLNLYAADSHHLAAAILEKADIMITCDERHLLTTKVRKEFNVVSPKEFLQEYGH